MVLMMRDIFSVKFPWNLWVMTLGLFNMAGGIYYIETPQGKAALAAIIGASLAMNLIYRKHGLVRLTGLGHIIFWPPLVIYFYQSLGSYPQLELFDTWLIFTLTINGLSLTLDVIDVARYFNGDKKVVT